MSPGRVPLAVIVMTALMIGVSVHLVATLPGDTLVPIHFGPDGEPDRWAGLVAGLLLEPVIALLLSLLFLVAPGLGRRQRGIEASPRALATIWVAVIAVMTGAHLIKVAAVLAVPVDRLMVFHLGMGGLFVILGNTMGKLRPNRFAGIRTPWTLADNRVWDRSHRFGGWVFVGAGLVMMASALIRDDDARLTVLLAAMSTAILLPVARSYFYWLARQREKD